MEDLYQVIVMYTVRVGALITYVEEKRLMPKKKVKKTEEKKKDSEGPNFFCTVCGKKNVLAVERNPSRYDRNTGHALHALSSMCPERFAAENSRTPIFGVLAGLSHDSLWVGEKDGTTKKDIWF